MSNYLDELIYTNQNYSGSSSASFVASGLAAVTSIVGLGALGPGSKPKALHTEFADGEANWITPYGSGTDIVFYLVRADRVSGADGESGVGGLSQGSVGSTGGINPGGLQAVGSAFGSATQTGNSFLGGSVQSSLNQVAVNTSMKKLSTGPVRSEGLAGPLTGLAINAEAKVGGTNQSFSMLESRSRLVSNILESANSLQSPRLSGVASERYFQEIINQSFSPNTVAEGPRTAEEILSSFSSGNTSDLSTMLAIASKGITNSKQLIEGINKGLIGFSTAASKAQSDRLGPNGYSRERLLK